MTAYEQAQRYVAAIPGAVSGDAGHNQTFSVACSLVNGFALGPSEAWNILCEYNSRCQPPWSEKDLEHKMLDAVDANHDKPRGHLLHKGTIFQVAERLDDAYNKANAGDYSKPVWIAPAPDPRVPLVEVLGTTEKLPEPLADGMRTLLLSAFLPGEGIRIVDAYIADDGKERTNGEGPVFTREDWLQKLASKGGDPNEMFSITKKTGAGIYIAINPLKEGIKDSDVSAFRHALLEFDSITPEEQWTLYKKSNVPATVVIHSGKDSVHAWVRVDAKNRREYDERVAMLYKHFEAYGLDGKNKNPSRLSRLAGARRFGKLQGLLAVNIGAESFTEWARKNVDDGLGKEMTVDTLCTFTSAEDPNCLLGDRWLCKEGSLLVVGQCLSGETPIFDPVSQTQISVRERYEIGKPFHVFSKDKSGEIVIAAANPPAMFARNPLLKFSFSTGSSITVTPRHRFWNGVEYISASFVAQQILEGGVYRLPSIGDIYLAGFRKDALSSKQTGQDSLGGCRPCPHLDGEQLQSLATDDQESLPSQADAREHSQDCLIAGGLDASKEHNRQNQSFSRHSKTGFYPLHQTNSLDALECQASPTPASHEAGSLTSQEQLAPRSCQTDTTGRTSGDDHQSSVGRRDFQNLPLYQASCDSRKPTPLSIRHDPQSRQTEDSKPTARELNSDLCLSFGPYMPRLNEVALLVKVEDAGFDNYFDFEVPEFGNYVATGVVNHNSGIGKSSLGMQIAISLCLGRPIFGIQVVRPLRVLLVQSENDLGDTAEMFQGVMTGMGLSVCTDEYEALQERFVIVQNSTHTGERFCDAIRRLIDKNTPDIVILDPLLSFIGDDISKQQVCSQFLRNWLNPIAQATGVAWIMMHHTGKPPSADKYKREVAMAADASYVGIGSSELVNWARAVAVLRTVGIGPLFELKLAKRGRRADAKELDGSPTNLITLKHGSKGIHWEQVSPVAQEAAEAGGGPVTSSPQEVKLSLTAELRQCGLGKFLDACPPGGETQNKMAERLILYAGRQAPNRMLAGRSTCKKVICDLVKDGILELNAEGKIVLAKPEKQQVVTVVTTPHSG